MNPNCRAADAGGARTARELRADVGLDKGAGVAPVAVSCRKSCFDAECKGSLANDASSQEPVIAQVFWLHRRCKDKPSPHQWHTNGTDHPGSCTYVNVKSQQKLGTMVDLALAGTNQRRGYLALA